MIVDLFHAPEDAARAERFLRLHRGGWCEGTTTQRWFKQRQADLTRSARIALCQCAPEPVFLKAVTWNAKLASWWEQLQATRDRHVALHRRRDLLSPFLHLRTADEWIRVYPAWPSDLSAFLDTPEGEDLPSRLALHITTCVAASLAALESGGVLHRDLKATNILIDAGDGSAARKDASDIALALADFSDPTTSGTDFWSAPENMDGDPTAWSPLFGLGLLAWKCLSRVPFRRIVRRFPLYNPKLSWPESGRLYLWSSPSPFARDMKRLPSDDWRDRTATPEREALLQFIRAAVTYDESERRERLRLLLESNPATTPAGAAAEWLAGKIRATQCVDAPRPDRRIGSVIRRVEVRALNAAMP